MATGRLNESRDSGDRSRRMSIVEGAYCVCFFSDLNFLVFSVFFCFPTYYSILNLFPCFSDDLEQFIVPPPPSATNVIDADGSRLIIEQIVNDNFKSYAGTQTLGPFHKYFSSIGNPMIFIP